MRLLFQHAFLFHYASGGKHSKNSRFLSKFLSLVFALLFGGGIAHAQLTSDPTLERGMKPYGSFEGGSVDSVSMTNGDLNLHIPLVSYPQRGGKLHLGFYVKFDNNSYTHTPPTIPDCTTPPRVCEYGDDVAGPLMEIVPDLRLTALVSGTIPPAIGPYASVRTADGSYHEMGAVSGGFRTIDATGFLCLSNCATVIDREGIRYTQRNAAGDPQKIEDPNGNFITATVGTNGVITGYQDTMLRTVAIPPSLGLGGTGFTSDTSGCTGTLPTATAYLWTPPGLQGGQLNYKICYANVYYGEQICEKSGTLTCSIVLNHAPLIQSIVLPNHTTWTFQYDSADPSDPNSSATGNLLQITFPTGGYIKYTWSAVYICQNPSTTTFTTYTYSVSSRTINSNDGTGDHTWHYSFVNVGAGAANSPYSTSSTDPLGQQTVHTLTALGGRCSFYETQTQISDSSASLVKTSTTDFHAEADPMFIGQSVDYTASNVFPIRVTTTWPSGKVTKVETDPDTGVAMIGNQSGHTLFYGNPIAKREYDYGSGSPGALLKTTTTTYQALTNASYLNNNLLSLPATVVVTGASGTAASTSYLYDQYAFQPSGVTTQHDSASPDGAAPGNVTTVQRWLNLPSVTNLNTKTTYYDTGTPYQVTDPRLNTTTYAYSSTFLGAYITQVTNALGQFITKNYDFNSGLVTTSTDLNNLPTTYGYDSMFRLTQVNHPDGGQEVIVFQETSTPFTATLTKKINSAVNQIRTNVFDGLGRITQTQLSDPQGTVFTDTTYDAVGRVHSVSNPYRSGTDPTSSPGLTVYGYDALDRKTSETYPDSSVLTTAYCGPSTLVTDPAGKWRRSRTDGLGRLVEVDEPNAVGATVAATGCPGTGEPIWLTSYSFDAVGNMTNVVQNGSHQRIFTYDSLSRLLTSNNPESGTITYTYDADGNVATKKDARAITTTYGYDALNRPTSRTYSNGDPSVTTTYDQATCLGLASCSNVGQRTSVTDAAGSEAWAFQVDKPNLRNLHVNQRTNTSGSLHITKSSTYILDLAGNVTQITYPTGRIVNYAYDSANRPKTATDSVNGITYTTGPQTPPTGCLAGAVCYTPQGSFYALSIGQSSSFTGLNLTHSYNNRLQPLEFKASSTGGNAIDISYSFVDATASKNAGHVFSITNNLDTTRSQTFSYDQVNRITAAQSASTFATSPAHCWGETYGLDAWGNLQSIAPTSNSSYTGCSEESGFTKLADTNNHLATFSYDASGNTANDSTIAYTWDGESQLKTASGVTYSYDGDGRRVAKVGSKLYWYGSGGEILAETDGVGNTLNEYIFFGGQRIAMLPMNATPDGSIEQGLTFWTDGTPVQIVNDPAGAHSGNNYLQITTSAPGYTSHSRQFIPVSPGETITFGGWAYRTSGTTGAVRWKLAALDANQNSVASVNPIPSDVSSATWTDQVGSYTIPTGVAFVYLYAEIYLPTATTVARFDDGFVTTSPLYYVEDFLGSSRVTTRSNGVVCYDADFYPYGGERPYTNGCIENNYKFEGKERDSETGNDDFGARYYSNRFGRWLSADWSTVPAPVPYANLTNPQTLNLYAMVSDNPESSPTSTAINVHPVVEELVELALKRPKRQRK